MIAYKVYSSVSGIELQIYTTPEKARNLVEEHRFLDLKTKAIEISVAKWIGLKVLGY